MNEANHSVLLSALRNLLRPLVKLLLNSGVTVQAMVEIVKEVYVEVAMNEFTLPGKKQSQSRVSILTGLTRKDVQRLVNKNATQDTNTELATRHHRAAGVIAGWVRDSEFLESGEPATLLINGDTRSFSSLVKRYSRDMPVRGMLDELLRVGAVERIGRDHVRLASRSYVPTMGDKEKIYMLGTDVADLIDTIDYNIQISDKEAERAPRFQRKVMYDNLSVEAVQEFKQMSAQRSQQLIEEFDRWLAQHDRDLNPDLAGTGQVRTGVGIYYFEETLSQEKVHEQVS